MSIDVDDESGIYNIVDKHFMLMCPPSRSLRADTAICDTDAEFESFITEMICTFIFVSVILNVKYINGSMEDIPNFMTIGFAYTAMILVTDNVSGGVLNPAIGIVQQVF